jgi:NRAMP (natural resistance-associated macrophage protein)-like metal ion transporter
MMSEAEPKILPPVVVKQPPWPKLREILGPGLIAGASDDDPSGIATYSQAGAQFGYALGWALLFSYPLICAIQQISAEIGRVTGQGLAGNLRRAMPRWLVAGIVGLVLIANTINIGADLGAMAASVRLIVPLPAAFCVAVFAVLSVLLEVFVRYSRYVSVLKWLTLSLFAYVATLFIAHVPWRQVAWLTFFPHIKWDGDYLTDLTAVFGTTISPYVFFWQAEEEVEAEQEDPKARPLVDAPEQAPGELRRIRLDTLLGMGFANAVAMSIVITTAATLHVHGITDIETSAQAAEALRPIAGDLAFAVFALGIIGTGLLALPVLAGSAAYALGEVLGWPVGLAYKAMRAKAFYGTIAVAVVLGALMNVSPIDPVKALFWTAVINGVVAVPVMAATIYLACSRSVMGEFTIGPTLKFFGWLATAVMAAAAVGMFATF